MGNSKDKHWLDAPDWWKKWKPLRWLAVTTILIGGASGMWSSARLLMQPSDHPETAEYLAVQSTPVKLMGIFNSYERVDAVTTQLTDGGFQWTRKRNHRMPDSEFPPRDLDSVEVSAFQHLDNEGSLILKFFNDRLYEAEFVPKNLEAYAEALRQSDARLKRDRIGKVEFVEGALRFASNVELANSPVGRGLKTSPYAIWQDQRLIRQRNQWDASYGSIPYKAKL